MSVKTKHPDITADRQAEWRLMRDAVSGESAIKAAGELYLRMPSGFKAMANSGKDAYDAYRGRAQFAEILSPSVSAMVGIVHSKEIKIEIPAAMEYLHEEATQDRMTLDAFHRRITRALLITGRFSVLADAPVDGGEPFLAGYEGEALINWDEDFYVLDETHMARTGFQWNNVPRFRVLELVKGRYVQTVWQGEPLQAEVIEARGRADAALTEVPFAVASSRDLSPHVEVPPLIGVARAALAIYQLSADYRLQLYMSGQETLVAINGPKPTAVGAMVVHEMNGGEGVTPDLKYVSPSCSGIEAHKQAMEDNRVAAVMAGARLFEQSSTVEESGEARKLRFASETATLSSIAMSSCALLEKALRFIATMKGLNPDEVIVTPPQDLLDNTLTPADALALVNIWRQGGMSYQTLYENLQKGGIASPERDHEEEYALLDEEGFNDPEPMASQPPNQGQTTEE